METWAPPGEVDGVASRVGQCGSHPYHGVPDHDVEPSESCLCSPYSPRYAPTCSVVILALTLCPVLILSLCFSAGWRRPPWPPSWRPTLPCVFGPPPSLFWGAGRWSASVWCPLIGSGALQLGRRGSGRPPSHANAPRTKLPHVCSAGPTI